jgi:ATP-dependent DNA helicase RecQ
MSVDESGDAVTRATNEPALDEALSRFGFEKFRPGQREAVETLMRVGRLLLVAPTGGGKSLTYQLPASVLPGTSLVISPLVSLMQDQVSALDQFGIPSTFLAATLDAATLRDRMRAVADGLYKLVYAAPERIVYPGFRSLLRDIECPLIAIDEAHCISEWGHDFRPEYMQLGDLLAEFSGARALACTATATPVVRDEILERLGLPTDTPQLVRGFARPNIALRAREVKSRKERSLLVDATLSETLGQPGGGRGCAIVYAATRKSSEEEAARLAQRGWLTNAYHAGLPGTLRASVHAAFAAGDTEIVTATNAFGMGIDRPDVRAVLHLAPPSSVEAYYQEVGRAGRDGSDAVGMLLVSPGDLPLRRSLIERDADGSAPASEIVRHKWNLFLELMRWAEGGSCRHDAILRYFGDEAETLAGCGRCDVCLALESQAAGGSEHSAEETTLLVRKALSGVARIHGRFGLQLAAKLLRGVDDERLERQGLNRVTTFGILKQHSDDWLTRLLRRCVTAGWVDFEGGDRPVVVLTQEGAAVMKAERPARIVLPPLRSPTLPAAPSGSGSSASYRTPGSRRHDPAADVPDAAALELFEALRSHRLEIAKTEGVPPYVVATDRSLRDVAMLRPRNRDELALAHGIGPHKLESYGGGLLDVVKQWSANRPEPEPTRDDPS